MTLLPMLVILAITTQVKTYSRAAAITLIILAFLGSNYSLAALSYRISQIEQLYSRVRCFADFVETVPSDIRRPDLEERIRDWELSKEFPGAVPGHPRANSDTRSCIALKSSVNKLAYRLVISRVECPSCFCRSAFPQIMNCSRVVSG